MAGAVIRGTSPRASAWARLSGTGVAVIGSGPVHQVSGAAKGRTARRPTMPKRSTAPQREGPGRDRHAHAASGASSRRSLLRPGLRGALGHAAHLVVGDDEHGFEVVEVGGGLHERGLDDGPGSCWTSMIWPMSEALGEERLEAATLRRCPAVTTRCPTSTSSMMPDVRHREWRGEPAGHEPGRLACAGRARRRSERVSLMSRTKL